MSGQRYPCILLFGAPGVGKGTQGAILACVPGFVHLSTGEIFRSIDAESEEGRTAAEYSAQGELVPDDLTVRIWKNWLRRQINKGRYCPDTDLLLLDGIPRNVRQAEILDEHIEVLRLVHFVAADEEAMVQRIKKRALEHGRIDDADEQVIRKRFEVYRQESEPVLRHYVPELVSPIEASGTPAEVLRAVLDCLIPVQNAHLNAARTG
jgi:adenylate kinase